MGKEKKKKKRKAELQPPGCESLWLALFFFFAVAAVSASWDGGISPECSSAILGTLSRARCPFRALGRTRPFRGVVWTS